MTEEEKKAYPKAFVCDGYLKKFTYKKAWSNLWAGLSEEEKNEFIKEVIPKWLKQAMEREATYDTKELSMK
jgi:hypothetical protein